MTSTIEQQPDTGPTTTVATEESEKTSKMSIYKKILFSVNGITLILSFILFIMGLVVNLGHLSYHEAWHVSYGFYNGSVLIITVSCIIMAISALGILGTWRENFCLLLAFCILLGLMVFVELALAVSFFSLATSGQLGIVVGQTMLKSLEHFSQTGYDGVTKAWNLVQTEFMCCGINDASDWHIKAFIPPTLPDSCCASVQLSDSQCRIDNKTFGPYEDGCLIALGDAIHDNSACIGAVVAIIALLQIGVIVVTSQLMKKNTKKPKSCPPFY